MPPFDHDSDLVEYIRTYQDSFRSKPRLASLYSDFSHQKQSNPDGYWANVDAWRNALVGAAREGLLPGNGRLSLATGPRLDRAFDGGRELGQPLSLGTVIDQCLASREMISVAEFMNAKSSIYEKGWVSNIHIPSPVELIKWTLRSIGIMNGSASGEQDVIIMQNLEEVSHKIMNKVAEMDSTPSSRIFSWETFSKHFANIQNSEKPLLDSDISLLILHLSRDKQVASFSVTPSDIPGQMPKTTIKFIPSSTFSRTKAAPPPVDENDIAIADLNSLSQNLKLQIEGLEHRARSSQASARRILAQSSVSEFQRKQALGLLRQKKVIEATIEKRQSMLYQVESVKDTIDEAAGQLEFVSAIKHSNKVMGDLNKQIGGVDKVDILMDEMHAHKDNADAVQQALGEYASEMGATVDEDELDQEMDALEKEEEQRRTDEKESERREKEKALLNEAPKPPTGVAEKEGDTGKEEELEKRLGVLSLKEP